MTDYSKMDHQQLYDLVQSGDPNAMTHTSQAWATHASAIQDATTGLQTNLTAIQSQWSGAAADAYFQQSQDVAQKMQTHADNANATSTAVGNTASALSWARNNMPQPPSWLEQETAKVDSNIVSGTIGFVLGGPGVNVASEMAKNDMDEKHQQAIGTMTQLASAYTAAQQQLPTSSAGGRRDDPGNGNGNGNGDNPGGAPGATPMPVPVYPVGGSPIGGSPVSVGHGRSVTGGGGGGYGGGGFGGGSGGPGGGGINEPVPVMHDPGGTSTQGTSFGSGGSTGSLYGGTGVGGDPGSGFGGGGGAGGLGEAGLGGLGGAGMGGFGSKSGGTGLGGGEGSGIGAEGGASQTSGSGSPYGAAARAAAGAGGEEEGAAGAQGQQGMMGGMGGRGGAGGSGGEERGNRAGFLRQDPDYWYGDKKAAPPGGVIE